MSNSSSSPVVLRIPQATVILIMLLAAFGALILASNNIDPRSTTRAQLIATSTATPLPVDAFAELEYVAWTGADGLVSFEHPKTWTPVQNTSNGPLGYIITPGQRDDTGFGLLAVPLNQLGLTSLPANPTAAEFILALRPGTDAAKIRPFDVGDLKGSALKETIQSQDPSTGTVVSTDRELVVIFLDPATVFILQALSPTTEWAKMQPVVEHAEQTLKLDGPGILAVVNQTFAAPTAAPTADASGAEPTLEPTVEPTAAATQAP